MSFKSMSMDSANGPIGRLKGEMFFLLFFKDPCTTKYSLIPVVTKKNKSCITL